MKINEDKKIQHPFRTKQEIEIDAIQYNGRIIWIGIVLFMGAVAVINDLFFKTHRYP